MSSPVQASISNLVEISFPPMLCMGFYWDLDSFETGGGVGGMVRLWVTASSLLYYSGLVLPLCSVQRGRVLCSCCNSLLFCVGCGCGLANGNRPLKWQVPIQWLLSPGLALCTHPRASAEVGTSLAWFISTSCCHAGALSSLWTLAFPCPAGSSSEWYMGESRLKLNSLPCGHFNHRALAMPNTVLQWLQCHVFSLSYHLAPIHFFSTSMGKGNKSNAWLFTHGFGNQTTISIFLPILTSVSDSLTASPLDPLG